MSVGWCVFVPFEIVKGCLNLSWKDQYLIFMQANIENRNSKSETRKEKRSDMVVLAPLRANFLAESD